MGGSSLTLKGLLCTDGNDLRRSRRSPGRSLSTHEAREGKTEKRWDHEGVRGGKNSTRNQHRG